MLESGFLTPLRVELVGWIDGRPEWRTLSPLRYRSARLDGVVEVPPGFDFDEASVPRLPLVWLVAGGRAKAEAAVHDYGYQTGGLVVDGVPRPLSRSAVDAVFWEAMTATPAGGTNLVTRALMYVAVRLAGWKAWRDHGKRAAELNPIWTSTGWPKA